MATEEDVLLREVDEDLSRDQTLERFRKYQVPLAVGAAAIVAAVAGFQIFDNQREAKAAEAAEAYAALSFAAEAEPSAEALAAFAAEDNGGYSVLAAMRAAARVGARGDLERARDLYAEVYESQAVSGPMRDYARLSAAYLLLDKRPDDAQAIAALVENDAFRAHADEITSAAALSSGAYEAARAGFEALAGNSSAPEGLRARAETYAAVADAAANGAELEASEAPPRDAASFIEQFGADLQAAGVPVGSSEPILPDLGGADGQEAQEDAAAEGLSEPSADSAEDKPDQ